MKSKHTPGPWIRKGNVAFDAQGNCVAEAPAYGNFPADKQDANARLIAAAPEMLEALELVLKITTNTTARKVIQDAIAKARGES